MVHYDCFQYKLADLQQTILIHSAAGAVGIAAIQLARMAGAEVSTALQGSITY